MNPDLVAVAWNGLPVYGARLIRGACEAAPGLRMVVIATKAEVPVVDLERHLGLPITYVEADRSSTWDELGLRVPGLFVHTGWAYPQFNALAREVRQSSGRVVSMVDNSWKGNLRQLMGAFGFRMFLRKRFDAVWVPGASGVRLMQFLGYPRDRVMEGLYGADPRLFCEGPPLPQRPKRITFVGQYIERKGLDLLADAWARTTNTTWELCCYGQGPLENRLRALPRCRVLPFLSPEEIAKALASSRFLILPSREEHWGLVVHEAALCGAGLLVSDAVGAAADLVRPGNGRVFRAGCADEILAALNWAERLGHPEAEEVGRQSALLAQNYGPERWAAGFLKLIENAPAQSSFAGTLRESAR